MCFVVSSLWKQGLAFATETGRWVMIGFLAVGFHFKGAEKEFIITGVLKWVG